MKKIITIILIMVFCTCQYGWAVEIIVGSDGQAKYASGSETPINMDNKITEAQKTDNSDNNSTKITKEEIQTLNNISYNSQTTNITKEAAVSLLYGTNVENNPKLLEIYDIAKKNPNFNQSDISKILTVASKSSDVASIKRALETEGLMPKHVGPRFYVLEKNEHLNNIIDTYLLLKNYGISEKDMSNILKIYTANHEMPPIQAKIVSEILNDNTIKQEDKVYYIYAKLYSFTEENDNIEKDMINAYQIMKKYPKIFKKDSDNSTLGDDVFWVLRFYRQKCKTAEMLNIVLSDSNIKDEDKLFRVLGKLEVLALKDNVIEENKNYPPILFKMAEEGRPLISYFWENDAHKYYEDEQVLQDVYNAYKLLMQAKIDDLDGDNGTSILTLHPELCKAEEITKKVLSDPKIAPKDKAKMIGRKIEKEYYNQYRQRSEVANTAIEKGIVPKYTASNLDDSEYEIARMTNNIQAYELMKKYPAFKDKDISFFISHNYNGNSNSVFNLYESVKKVVNNKNIADNDKSSQLFREFLLTQNNDNNVKLFDAGIISLENDLYKDRFYYDRGEEQTQSIINAYKAMKQAGFKDSDIIYIIDDMCSNEYLEQAVKQIINDSSIEKYDIFAFSYANIEKQKSLSEKEMPESYYKAVNDNIIPLYYDSTYYKDEEFYEKLAENINIMKNELGYTGQQIEDILSMSRDKELYRVSTKVQIDIMNKVLKDENINKEDKISTIEKEYREVESHKLAKALREEFCDNLRTGALIIVTAPLWLPVAVVLGAIIIVTLPITIPSGFWDFSNMH